MSHAPKLRIVVALLVGSALAAPAPASAAAAAFKPLHIAPAPQPPHPAPRPPSEVLHRTVVPPTKVQLKLKYRRELEADHRERRSPKRAAAERIKAKAKARAARSRRVRRLLRRCLHEGVKSAATRYRDALFDSAAAELVPTADTGQLEAAIESCLKELLGPLGDLWDAGSTLVSGFL